MQDDLDASRADKRGRHRLAKLVAQLLTLIGNANILALKLKHIFNQTYTPLPTYMIDHMITGIFMCRPSDIYNNVSAFAYEYLLIRSLRLPDDM